MEQIVIGFSTVRKRFSLFSWAIRAVEQTKYSHVYIKFWSESMQRWLIYQASHMAVNFMGEQRFLNEEIIIEEFVINVTPEQKAKILQYCVDTVGTPYGVSQIFGMAYARVLARLGYNMYNPFSDGSKTMVCSELAGHILMVMGEEVDPFELEIQGPKWIHEKVVELVKKQRVT